jgi:UDP-N-acetylmuramoyl-L-alanine---L-glutamate ligase
MFQPTGINSLRGQRVGLFGLGIEGQATLRVLRALDIEPVLVDDQVVELPGALTSQGGGLEALAHCDVVLKSPGIPRRRPDIVALEARGVCVTSMLNLWLHDIDRSRVIAVTGTKGKSTTTSLIGFFLECLGQQARTLGNLGTPPYDPAVNTDSGWLVLEVSSFQCVDIDVSPGIVALTSLGSDHLDWHGDLATYQADKLSLLQKPGDHQSVVARDTLATVIAHGLDHGVHEAAHSDLGLARELGLLGAHSASNVAVALSVVALVTHLSVDEVAEAARTKVSTFEPLKGRLTRVGELRYEHGSVVFVDDGLATNPLATLAAVRALEPLAIALIVGGHDRGVDYQVLHEGLRGSTVVGLVTMGPAGERIGELGRVHAIETVTATDMGEAIAKALELLPVGGVVLLSPAAPSFDRYRDWRERSDDFTARCLELIGRV